MHENEKQKSECSSEESARAPSESPERRAVRRKWVGTPEDYPEANAYERELIYDED